MLLPYGSSIWMSLKPVSSACRSVYTHTGIGLDTGTAASMDYTIPSGQEFPDETTELWRPFGCLVKLAHVPGVGWISSPYEGPDASGAHITPDGVLSLFGHTVCQRPDISVWTVTAYDDPRSHVNAPGWRLTRCEVVWADEVHEGGVAAAIGSHTDHREAPVATLHRHYIHMESTGSDGSLTAGDESSLMSSTRELNSEEVKVFGTKDRPHEDVSIPASMVSVDGAATSGVSCTIAGLGCRVVGEVHQVAQEPLNWSLRGCAVKLGVKHVDGRDVFFSGYVSV